MQVLERRVVRGDHSRPGPRLDRHVADRHALVHGERPHRRAAILDGVAGGARGADAGDEAEDQVLGGDARGQAAVHLDREGLRLALQQALGGQDVADLAGADPEGQCPERAVGRGVAVAADDGEAGLGQAQLGPDHVDDALAVAAHGEEPDPEVAAVPLEGSDLLRGRALGGSAATSGAEPGGDRVVHGGDGAIGPAHPEATLAQQGEGLGRGDLVDEVEVDVEDRGRILGGRRHEVRLPELVEERPRSLAHAVASMGAALATRAAATAEM